MKILQHSFTDSSIDSISEVIKSGNMGFGSNVEKLETAFKVFNFEKKYNTAVSSASASAFIIFAYLKEQYGSCDVYTPSIGFTSPAWAAKHHGHNLIFVDIDDNLLFDIKDYKNQRRLRSKRYENLGVKPVLMPILYGGVSNIPNFEKIHKDGYNEIIVVDAAHCPHPTIKSDFSFTSFHPTKPICSSDGGMISTSSYEADQYFKNYRNFGRRNTNQGYDITQEGFKFYMNNLNATIAIESIKTYDECLEIRKSNYKKIKNKFPGKLLEHDMNSSFYFATFLSEHSREINTKYQLTKHYPPLHMTKFYNLKSISLTNTESKYPLIVNIPLYKQII